MNRGWLVGLTVAGIALAAAALVRPDPEAARPWSAPATTFSPGPTGAKAFFLLLDRVGVRAERWRRAGYDGLHSKVVLWVLTPQPFGRVEQQGLIHFLERGGTVVAPPQSLAPILVEAGHAGAQANDGSGALDTAWGTPLEAGAWASISGAGEPEEVYATAAGGTPVVAAYAVGEGRAVSFGLHEIVRNERIGDAAHGPFLVRLALALGKRHVFDEFKAGFGEEDFASLLMRAPYRWGLAQLGLAGAVWLLAVAQRRWPADSEPPASRRRTIDHIEAVARLWGQAQDAGLPLECVLGAHAERARTRLGGFRQAGGRPVFVDWVARMRSDLASEAQRAWERAEAVARSPRPSAEAARRAAADLKTLEREAGRWSKKS